MRRVLAGSLLLGVVQHLEVRLAPSLIWLAHALFWSRRLASQHQPQIILSLDGVKGRGVAADGLAFAIHQKFDIVPLNLALLARQGEPKGTEGTGQGVGQCIPQQLVHWMNLFPIDLNLVHDWELDAKLLVRKLALALGRSWCLTAKLIARKGQQRESLILVLLVQGPQRWVVAVLQGSFTGDIHDDGCLAFELVQADLFVILVRLQVPNGTCSIGLIHA